MLRRAVLTACLLSAAPAWAAGQAPRVLPAGDVAVTYRASGPALDAIPFLGAGGAPTELHLAWTATGRKLAVTATGRMQRMLVDLPGHMATVLDDSMHVALMLPMRETDVQGLTMANAQFTRRGQATVAGEACTDWAVRSDRSAGTVCITADGVPLRGEGDVNGRHGSFIATAIDRSPQGPAGFGVPPGYNRLDLPRFGGR